MTHPARSWLILTGLILGVCVTNGFARFAYGLILPAMKSELGWTYTQAGWLNTANAIGYIAGAVLTMILIRWISPSRLFSVGLVTTTLGLLATGLDAALWWQSLWRILVGISGALSFSTAGALTAQLFPDSARRNALAIALLFGVGGGSGVMLAGGTLPLMLDALGPSAWPYGWVLVGAVSVLCVPLGLWAAESLRPPRQISAPRPTLPIRRMLPEFTGYAAFGLGYIVYFTFLSVWMTEQGATGGQIAAAWVLLGLCLCASPFVWRPVFARFASGMPLAMILTCIAGGSALPVLVQNLAGQTLSAVIFGLSVFMAPGAITNFTRQNLPIESWGAALSLFTVIFAVSQTLGPIGAGLIGDATGDIGHSLLAAAGVLLLGAAVAASQRPLRHPGAAPSSG